MHDSFILSIVGSLSGFFDSGWHFHLSLEIDLRLLVAFLPILDLLVSTLDQMVACSNMIMPVILDAFLGILFIKIEFINDFTE